MDPSEDNVPDAYDDGSHEDEQACGRERANGKRDAAIAELRPISDTKVGLL